MTKCAILGGGGWGIALSKVLDQNGHRVKIWEIDAGRAKDLTRRRSDPEKLPGVKIPKAVEITSDLSLALSGARVVVFAVPVQFTRSTIRRLKAFNFSKTLVVNVSKGVEIEGLKRVSEILSGENKTIGKNNYVVLSGPSHAEEVGRGVPTTLVAASHNPAAAKEVQRIFSAPYLRVYTGSDVAGVELGGALKNVIALAAGILDGMGLGDNTKGALLTRGIAEMTRLGVSLGAKKETFYGLSGIGDLITTCISKHSRNRHVGEALGRGKKLAQVLRGLKMVAEGVPTAKSAHALAQAQGVEMPIMTEVYNVLFKNKDSRLAVKKLMERELKAEGL